MLHILHVNDTETSFSKWAHISTLVQELRKRGQCDLLVHTGDFRLGATEDVDTVHAMNHIGFDVVTLGNHDVDQGLSGLVPQLELLRAAKVCANACGVPGVVPYRLIERQNLKVAVLGVTLEEMGLFQPDRNIPRIQFRSARSSLHEILSQVRHHADLVVLLSHCGLDTDVRLAQEVAGIDLIVGGHSHDLLREPLRVGNTWVVQAGAYGEHVGHVQLTRVGQGWHATGRVLPTAGIPADPAVVAPGPALFVSR